MKSQLCPSKDTAETAAPDDGSGGVVSPDTDNDVRVLVALVSGGGVFLCF